MNDARTYTEYIYGSAEVVGLMCLYIFCDGNLKLHEQLKPAAGSLRAAFQKVNFLRDINADFNNLSRIYFPGMDIMKFDAGMKEEIEKDIASDFEKAYKGIIALPWKSKFGVYVAYKYYYSLFRKINRIQASHIMRQRVRIPKFSEGDDRGPCKRKEPVKIDLTA